MRARVQDPSSARFVVPRTGHHRQDAAKRVGRRRRPEHPTVGRVSVGDEHHSPQRRARVAGDAGVSGPRRAPGPEASSLRPHAAGCGRRSAGRRRGRHPSRARANVVLPAPETPQKTRHPSPRTTPPAWTTTPPRFGQMVHQEKLVERIGHRVRHLRERRRRTLRRPGGDLGKVDHYSSGVGIDERVQVRRQRVCDDETRCGSRQVLRTRPTTLRCRRGRSPVA